MPTFSADELVAIGTRIFVAAGTPEPVAKRVAGSLVLSNLVGVDSHGVIRIPQYLEGIEAGEIVPDAEPAIVRDNGVVVLMDGQNAFGQIAAERAMQLAIERARKRTIGLVSFAQVQHIGRLGEWAALATDEGLFGLVMVNGAPPGGRVAPFGSRQPVMGTNPIAFAVPAGSYPPLVGDFSTAVVAEGRVRLALQTGDEIPLGWVVDRQGRPTTNPADLYAGGALLTFGQHKGYCLSLMVEVLAGILSGANTPIDPEYKRLQNGVFMLALDVAFFRPAAEYDQAVDTLVGAVKQAQPAEGMNAVLLPGELESQRRAERERDGIPVADDTWRAIQRAAARLEVR